MASDSAFIVWISNYGQMVLFFAQILFWVAVGVAAIWATLIFRRYVNARIAETAPAAGAPADAAAPAEPVSAAPAPDISVDEFVE